ncbi:apoptosis regulator BAX-like [Nerophis ophidion]|uniref:apoptosis regulator BAX-like n=1 Tax=Nerophis ophidion TaxID=159077 RepID=UPI002ADF7B31|nr:apoptosis regulator BAX-like [Nerophis ophidion]
MAHPAGDVKPGNTTQQLLKVGADLLKDYIFEQVRRYGDRSAGVVVTREQLGGGELSNDNHKQLVQCLLKTADEMDGNVELDKTIETCPLNKEIFMKVALAIFSDGELTWGRVVALFYFTCRLVIKAVLHNIPDIIRTIISWTVDYLRENLLSWIRDQGGWEGIRAYLVTPTWQKLAVFLADVLTAVTRKM